MNKTHLIKTLFTGLTALTLFTSAIFTVHADDQELHKYYGTVTEHGIECPQQGFKLELSDDFTIENRGDVTLNGEFSHNEPNDEKTYELIDITSHFFSAVNADIAIDMYVADPGVGYEKWADLAEVAQNTFDDNLNEAKEKPEYTDPQGSCTEDTFVGQKCYINRFTFTVDGDLYYRTEIFLMSPDNKYLTTIYLDSWYQDNAGAYLSCFTSM